MKAVKHLKIDIHLRKVLFVEQPKFNIVIPQNINIRTRRPDDISNVTHLIVRYLFVQLVYFHATTSV
jgi:hypothetical protein